MLLSRMGGNNKSMYCNCSWILGKCSSCSSCIDMYMCTLGMSAVVMPWGEVEYLPEISPVHSIARNTAQARWIEMETSTEVFLPMQTQVKIVKMWGLSANGGSGWSLICVNFWLIGISLHTEGGWSTWFSTILEMNGCLGIKHLSQISTHLWFRPSRGSPTRSYTKMFNWIVPRIIGP